MSKFKVKAVSIQKSNKRKRETFMVHICSCGDGVQALPALPEVFPCAPQDSVPAWSSSGLLSVGKTRNTTLEQRQILRFLNRFILVVMFWTKTEGKTQIRRTAAPLDGLFSEVSPSLTLTTRHNSRPSSCSHPIFLKKIPF